MDALIDGLPVIFHHAETVDIELPINNRNAAPFTVSE
jgi:hypothetical protein